MRSHDDIQELQWKQICFKDKVSDYEWDREGEPVDDAIAAAGMPQEAAMDIRQILAERFSGWDAAMSGQETEFDGESY